MAKYGALWDDSALVKALDDAISKYKMMHGKGEDKSSLKEENFTKGTEESAPTIFGNTTDVPNNTTYTSPSNGVQVQDTEGSFVTDEHAEYYHLLNQYNAVEEQRQKLLQQLYQYGNWDNQTYAYGPFYDTQYPAPQQTGPPDSTTQYTPSCKTCVGSTELAQNESSVSLEADKIIKAAMGAVDKAIRSFNTQTSGISEVDQGNVSNDKSSETDLSVVLNAWFSAGFFTGKYISEQSSGKK